MMKAEKMDLWKVSVYKLLNIKCQITYVKEDSTLNWKTLENVHQ